MFQMADEHTNLLQDAVLVQPDERVDEEPLASPQPEATCPRCRDAGWDSHDLDCPNDRVFVNVLICSDCGYSGGGGGGRSLDHVPRPHPFPSKVQYGVAVDGRDGADDGRGRRR